MANNTLGPPSRQAHPSNAPRTPGQQTLSEQIQTRRDTIQNGGTSSTTQGFNYDNRVGAGALPAGMYGSQNKAYVRDVQPGELTSENLTNLLASDSRYINEARNQGREQALSRGLGVFSGMGGGFAERAAIAAGAPIAQADAQAHITAAGQNQQYLNQMALAAMSQGPTVITDRGDSAWNAERDREHQLQMQREGFAFQGEQQGLDRQFQQYMSNLGYSQDLGRMSWGSYYDDAAAERNFSRQEATDYRTAYINMMGAQHTFDEDMLRYAMENPDTFDPETYGRFVQYGNQLFAPRLNYFFQAYQNMRGGG